MNKQTRKSREDVHDLPLKVKAEMALKEAVAETLWPSTSYREIPLLSGGMARPSGYRRKKSSCRKFKLITAVNWGMIPL